MDSVYFFLHPTEPKVLYYHLVIGPSVSHPYYLATRDCPWYMIRPKVIPNVAAQLKDPTICSHFVGCQPWARTKGNTVYVVLVCSKFWNCTRSPNILLFYLPQRDENGSVGSTLLYRMCERSVSTISSHYRPIQALPRVMILQDVVSPLPRLCQPRNVRPCGILSWAHHWTTSGLRQSKVSTIPVTTSIQG